VIGVLYYHRENARDKSEDRACEEDVLALLCRTRKSLHAALEVSRGGPYENYRENDEYSVDYISGGNYFLACRCCRNSLSCGLIASGGISSLEEIEMLADMDLSGAILGKALYTGLLDLKEVIDLC